MERIDSVPQMQAKVASLRTPGHRVALLPTQGALHPGHTGLIEVARKQAGTVVVSTVVNPLQFGPSEDPARYPRDPEGDIAFCQQAGVDFLFAPPIEQLFPKGFSTYVMEETLSRGLCGVSRPTHFRGVATMLTKLLNIVRPDVVMFGQKNAQQAAVARKLIQDLSFNAQVLVQPTMREPDGLPYGARNRLLTSSQREEATVVYRALTTGKALVETGVRNVDRVIAEATHVIGTSRRVRVIYIAIVDRDTMEPERQIVPGRSLLMVSVWVDEIRMIDNMLL
jgi:pantoate--beta-alanine ligase